MKEELEGLEGKEEEIKVFKAELDDKYEQIRKFREEQARLEGVAEVYKADLENKDDQIRKLKEELALTEDREENFKTEIDDKYEQIRKFREEQARLEGLAEMYKADLDEKDDHIRKCKEELDKNDDQIRNFREELVGVEAKEKEMELFRAELGDKNDQIQKLTEDLAQLEEKEEEIKSLKAEIQRMVQNQESQEEARIGTLALPDVQHQLEGEMRESEMISPETANLQLSSPYQTDTMESSLAVPMATVPMVTGQGQGDVMTETELPLLTRAPPGKEGEMKTSQIDGPGAVTLGISPTGMSVAPDDSQMVSRTVMSVAPDDSQMVSLAGQGPSVVRPACEHIYAASDANTELSSLLLTLLFSNKLECFIMNYIACIICVVKISNFR